MKKSWFRWNFNCLRGRRCSDVVFTNSDQVKQIREMGGTIRGTHQCSGCGTVYWMRCQDEPRRECTEEPPPTASAYGGLDAGEAVTLLVPLKKKS